MANDDAGSEGKLPPFQELRNEEKRARKVVDDGRLEGDEISKLPAGIGVYGDELLSHEPQALVEAEWSVRGLPPEVGDAVPRLVPGREERASVDGVEEVSFRPRPSTQSS